MRVKAIVLTACLLTGACNSAADANVFSMPSGTEAKPDSSVALSQGFGATSAQPTPAATVTYIVTATTAGGVKVCDGEAQIVILSNFTMQFPAASVTCLTLSIDLAAILGAGLANGSSNNLGSFSSDGKVLSTKTLGAATFSPPRPFLLGPVIQDVSIYQGFNQTYQSTVSGTLPSTGQSYDAPGQFAVEVLQTKTTYSNNYVGAAFNNVLDWKVTTSGFAGVPASMGLLFRSIEWFWNVNPIMIPKIVISGDLTDFVSNTSAAGSGSTSTPVASALLGQLTIDLSVKSYNFSE